MSLARVRREYHGRTLTEARAPADPIVLFTRWLAQALRSTNPEPNAMTLATVDGRGRPRARMVLLKDVGPEGFTFYTNLTSAKAREIAARRDAALVLFWPEFHRQVRIEGRISAVSAAEADEYFALRPRGARLGAWASPQSRVLASRSVLERRLAAIERRFADRDVPRPPHWGGYRLTPRAIEFWQGRPSRLHDRLRYTRRADGWVRSRLAP